MCGKRKIQSAFLLILLFAFQNGMQAQQVDSTYRNYLYDSRLAYFKQLPVVKGAIVFWGDSITHWGDWAEFMGFKKVLNRGVAGDNTYGLRARVDEIVRHQPKKLFILIGTNDINKRIPVTYIVENYKKIIDEVKKSSPATEIYVQSVFPINNDLIGRQYYSGTNEQIVVLNKALKEMADTMKVSFVNLYPVLLDSSRQLDAKYTYDGLHLSGAGYLVWVDYLKKQHVL
ncbi:MAG: GDSL-type esterase/lipase family protein [Chitinophagaceae bacterium]